MSKILAAAIAAIAILAVVFLDVSEGEQALLWISVLLCGLSVVEGR